MEVFVTGLGYYTCTLYEIIEFPKCLKVVVILYDVDDQSVLTVEFYINQIFSHLITSFDDFHLGGGGELLLFTVC